MLKQPALVGIVPRKNLWQIIQEKRWYHIPVKSAPRNFSFIEYLAFYFPKAFDEKEQYQVIYYAKVKSVKITKRINLFPEAIGHPKANADYFQFHLSQIKTLPQPIPSQRWRRIVHIPTSYQRLMAAQEINDLYDTSPLEEKMYQNMKRRKISAERQLYVKANDNNYCLDFGIFCQKGNIDVECDGEKYHILPEALAHDRKRNNQLASLGWRVLRFSGREINRTVLNCLGMVETTIGNLGGLKPL